MMMLSIPLAAMLALAAPVQDPAAGKTAAVAPVIVGDVGLVVHVDLMKWEPEPFLRRSLGKMVDEQDVNGAIQVVGAWVDAMKKAGARDIYLLFDLADMPGTPVAAVPLNGGDGEAIAGVLTGRTMRGPIQWPGSETIRGVVVAGMPASLARIKAAPPVARPEVVEALAVNADSPIQVVLVPNSTVRRVVEEAIPALPPQLGGGSIKTLSQGLKWASFSMAFEPRSALRGVFQAKDADSAKEIEKFLQGGLGFLTQITRQEPAMAPLAAAIAEIKPQVAGGRVSLESDLEKAASLIAVPVGQARVAAGRSRSVNNLKQIGLAMHNYLSTHNTFPAAYSVGKDGKPLLSWRVHILPFLEQQTLYNQFHLDEAWDSPHNKALISQMPMTYASPAAARGLAAEGKTTYLTPRGPNTMFPGATGVKIQEITDGTSNTIMTVEANDNAAVIWTKPDDWEIGAAANFQALAGHYPGGANIGFADGSVKFLKATIKAKVLQALLTMKGGEPIGADEY